MDKTYFYKLFDKIVEEIKDSFNTFAIEVDDYKPDESDEGKLYGCDAIVRLKTDKMYMSFWFGFSTTEHKPFEFKVAFSGYTDKKQGFSLTDYTTFRNIPFDRSLIFRWLDEYEDSIDISKQLFKGLIKIIETEEMQKMLYTDYTLEVPIDYYPYK